MILEYAPNWQVHFEWVVYVAFVVAFLVAFGMGANDCANSYGTVVGSGVLKIWKAYVLATIFETLGAVLLGYKVTNTMRKSIVSVDYYDVHSAEYVVNDTLRYDSHFNSCTVNQTALSMSSPAGFNYTGKCDTYTNAQFMLGQLGVLIGTAFWLILATVIHLPVSTTHSAVGATIGFSLVLKGADGINWSTIINIVVSWIASPALAGFFSVIFYLVIKYSVFNRAYPFEASLQMMPIFYFFALTVNSFSILYDGSKYLYFDRLHWTTDLMISLAIGSTVAILMFFWGKDLIRSRVLRTMSSLSSRSKTDVILTNSSNADRSCKSSKSSEKKDQIKENGHHNRPHSQHSQQTPKITVASSNGNCPNSADLKSSENSDEPEVVINCSLKDVRFTYTNDDGAATTDSGFQLTPTKVSKFQTRNASENCTQTSENTLSPTPFMKRREETAIDARSLKERLKRLKHPVDENPLAAQVFNYLQVLSACFLSFSHGSNDTANAVGPLVGLWIAYQQGHAAKESEYDWSMILLILFGAVSMIIGLWVLGHKVINTIGTKITQVTPPSGFAMELGTGFTVLVASKVGIPVSTTHCAVGAVVCVGWFKSHEGGVSWKIFRNIAIAWVVTLPVASAVAALAAWLLNLCVL